MPTADLLAVKAYQGRTWVTRPRPGVDRMASAWLIRRFIDPKARFVFDDAPPSGRSSHVAFDMYGVDFGHHGGRCTFEVLAERFGIKDEGVRRIGEIVHDVDLKDARFNHPEASMVAALVEGLRRSYTDDQDLLTHGMAIFAGFYESHRGPVSRPKVKRRQR